MKHVRTVGILIGIILNSLILGIPALCIGLIQTPQGPLFWPVINVLYHRWISHNSALLRSLPTPWHIEGDLSKLDPKQSYLIVANHQSWADILIIQGVFNHKIDHLYFVLKASLKWIPIAGWMCMLFGYPFMHRISAQKMRHNPKLRQQNRQHIKTACQRFKRRPGALLLFLEGTRRRAHRKQPSTYQHLLAPKTSGLITALQAWPDGHLNILDVTLNYHHPQPTAWRWLTGDIPKITIEVKMHAPPKQLDDKKVIKDWIHAIWQQKDDQLS